MRAQLLNLMRWFWFRFLVSAAGLLLLLGCIWASSFVMTFLRAMFAHRSESPAWWPVLSIPIGALLFVGIVRLFGLIEWFERVSKKGFVVRK
jgi:hypothetical protein